MSIVPFLYAANNTRTCLDLWTGMAEADWIGPVPLYFYWKVCFFFLLETDNSHYCHIVWQVYVCDSSSWYIIRLKSFVLDLICYRYFFHRDDIHDIHKYERNKLLTSLMTYEFEHERIRKIICMLSYEILTLK